MNFRRVTLCLVVGALCSIPAFAKDKLKSTRQTFEFEGKQRVCWYFIPSQEGPLPVLMLLHGSGRNGEVMINQWKDLAAREGIVLVAPDAYDPVSWNLKPDSPLFFHTAIEIANTLHPIDPARIYLFGHSAGAEYGLILSLLDANQFAAVAVHAGLLLPSFRTAFQYAQRRMPIAIWVGDRDPNFPAVDVKETVRLFESNGYQVKFTVMPLHDHNYYAVSGEVNRKAWEFLKQATLPIGRAGQTP